MLTLPQIIKDLLSKAKTISNNTAEIYNKTNTIYLFRVEGDTI